MQRALVLAMGILSASLSKSWLHRVLFIRQSDTILSLCQIAIALLQVYLSLLISLLPQTDWARWLHLELSLQVLMLLALLRHDVEGLRPGVLAVDIMH